MAAEWLIENAAPVICYRTLAELMDVSDTKLLQRNIAAVLSLPQTQKRLALLKNLDFSRIHGSNSTYLENVLPMLSDFGLHYEIDAFRQVADSCMASTKLSYELLSYYDRIIACPFLLRSKIPHIGLLDFAIERIHTIHDFTKHMNFDIYDDIKDYKGVPKSFQNRPLIKPALAYGDKCKLPLIYDIAAMAEVYHGVPPGVQEKIDNIINYVLSPEYDIVECMYGILSAGQRKYYAMGWDCKKPFNDNQGYSNPNLHRLLLYSHFPTAVKSMWFQNAMDYLMQYRTQNGTFIFPKAYLPETDSNWILGSHMSLMENRRQKQWIEIESTFYMLKVLKKRRCFNES